MNYSASVIVKLKDGIKDPQGTAIEAILKRIGLDNDSEVRVGKYFSLQLSANNDLEAQEKLNKICNDVLSNPILETYLIERLEKL